MPEQWTCPKCGKAQDNKLRCTGCGYRNSHRGDLTMTEAEFDSLALTRRRLEEIINSDDSKETKLNHLCSVVYDAWEHRLSCPDAERDRLGEDESFTTLEE